jgi:hypothetical protein
LIPMFQHLYTFIKTRHSDILFDNIIHQMTYTAS